MLTPIAADEDIPFGGGDWTPTLEPFDGLRRTVRHHSAATTAARGAAVWSQQRGQPRRCDKWHPSPPLALPALARHQPLRAPWQAERACLLWARVGLRWRGAEPAGRGRAPRPTSLPRVRRYPQSGSPQRNGDGVSTPPKPRRLRGTGRVTGWMTVVKEGRG